MKRKLGIAFAIVGLFCALIYFAPIIVSTSKAKPLYGNFDMQAQCMGGHEIFLFLAEDEAFTHCPGHREMNPLGIIERHESYVIISSLDGGSPMFKIHYDESTHRFESLRNSSQEEVPQVNNPWRTFLPKFLPEH